MRYWWVSHSDSVRKEVGGGYIWCPQVGSQDRKRVSWLNLKLVRPGDTIFSYADQKIGAIGVATSEAQDSERPQGYPDKSWKPIGWRVDVDWTPVRKPISPKSHIDQIRDLLPPRHSPLRSNGDGLIVYLVEVSRELAKVLLDLAGAQDPLLADRLEVAEVVATAKDETTRLALFNARVGQGVFRDRVLRQEPRCRVTGTTDPSLLVASHIKSWKTSDNEERLSGANGLMLAPHVDRLFDRGYISFSNRGDLLLRGVEVEAVLKQWSLHEVRNVGPFTEKQQAFLACHRTRWGFEK